MPACGGEAEHLQPVREDGAESEARETRGLRAGQREPAPLREKPADLEEALAPGLDHFSSLR